MHEDKNDTKKTQKDTHTKRPKDQQTKRHKKTSRQKGKTRQDKTRQHGEVLTAEPGSNCTCGYTDPCLQAIRP